MGEKTKIGKGQTQPDGCDSLRVIREQIIWSDVGFLQPARGVQRTLRYDVRHFMNNDPGNCARENPLAFPGGFIPKVSMEHLNKSVAIHIDKWLDMLIDHKHPPERRSRRVLRVARRVNSAIPSELDLVDQAELHAFVEFIPCHPYD